MSILPRQKIFLTSFLVLTLLCLTTGFAAEKSVPVSASPQAGYLIHAHAHNDYEHERPLFDALDNRFYSVEADIWLVEGEILVSHHAGKYKGSLKDLYLDPLQKRIDEKGSVHEDGETFYLWLDLKDGSAELRLALRNLLKDYSMFTLFTEDKITPGPVEGILTGDAKSKTEYISQFPERRVCRDSNYYSIDDPQADNGWRWYALKWSNYISWNGQGEIPEELYQKLVDIVNDSHSKGRKIRFWSTPDKESFWDLSLKAGIDHINTDKLPQLSRFLKTRSK